MNSDSQTKGPDLYRIVSAADDCHFPECECLYQDDVVDDDSELRHYGTCLRTVTCERKFGQWRFRKGR